MFAAITDFFNLPAVQSALILGGVGVISFFGRSTRNLVIKTIHDFRDDILAIVNKTTAKRDEQIECMTRGLQEVKDEVIAVGLQVELINGTVRKNSVRLDRLEAPKPRRKKGEAA